MTARSPRRFPSASLWSKQVARTVPDALALAEALTEARRARPHGGPPLAERSRTPRLRCVSPKALPLTEGLARTKALPFTVGATSCRSAQSLTRVVRRTAGGALGLTGDARPKGLTRTLAGEAFGLHGRGRPRHYTGALTVTLAGEALGLTEQLTRLGITARLLPEARRRHRSHCTRRLTLLRSSQTTRCHWTSSASATGSQLIRRPRLHHPAARAPRQLYRSAPDCG